MIHATSSALIAHQNIEMPAKYPVEFVKLNFQHAD